MVKLNGDMIERATSNVNKRKPNESHESFLRRVTHLHLENKCIDSISNEIFVCRNVTVLYLYDNALQEIPDLSGLPHIRELYLQNNDITRMRNLSSLSQLVKLHLGCNRIIVLEGANGLSNLAELYLENQKLPPGEKMIFDPRSVAALSSSLECLNVSGNSLEQLLDLSPLRRLNHLQVSHNDIHSMDDISQSLQLWSDLRQLDLTGNPLTKHRQYRDQVIVLANKLETLDGKEIKENARRFVQNLSASREASKMKQANSQHKESETSHANSFASSHGDISAGPMGSFNGLSIYSEKDHKALGRKLSSGNQPMSSGGPSYLHIL